MEAKETSESVDLVVVVTAEKIQSAQTDYLIRAAALAAVAQPLLLQDLGALAVLAWSSFAIPANTQSAIPEVGSRCPQPSRLEKR